MTDIPLNPFNFPSPAQTDDLQSHSTDTPIDTKPFSISTPVSTPNYPFSGGLLTSSPAGNEWFNPHDGSPVSGEGYQSLHTVPSQMYTGDIEQNYTFHPQLLNYHSSNSSLASLSSSPSQTGNISSSLIVQTYPQELDSIQDLSGSTIHPTNDMHNLSRHSSFSSLASYDGNRGIGGYQPPFMGDISQGLQGSIPPGSIFGNIDQDGRLPKLGIQTQGLGRVTGRTRSMSRTMPYARHHKSESLSAASEEDENDPTALLSSSTTQSSYPTPWSAVTNTSIAGGLGRMTLHHRRLSSTSSSPLKTNSLSRPNLSRNHRSSSFITKRTSQSDIFNYQTVYTQPAFGDPKVCGTADERSETVRRDLLERAQAILGMASVSAQDKGRTAWVRRWLQLSYTEERGSTVPRQGLYHSYTLSCKDHNLKPVNSASFGKAVRSAFLGIKTRRLGVRGNSKYHYVAIRPAVSIEAERLNAFGDSSGQWHVAPEDGVMRFSHDGSQDVSMEGEDVDDEECEEDDDSFGASPHKRSPSTDVNTREPRARGTRRHTTSELSVQTPLFTQTPQVQSPIYTLPNFPSLSLATHRGADVEMGTLQAFWDGFCKHLEVLAGCVRDYHFDRYEMNLRTFWTSLTDGMIICCQDQVVSGMIAEAMVISIDNMMDILLSKLLTQIPVHVKECIERLARNLENIMDEAFRSFGREFADPKIELVVRAAHLLLRFVDLQQLTCALIPILSAPEQVRTMLQAWDALSSRSLLDTAALTVHCKQDILESIMSEFHGWLLDVESVGGKGGKGLEKLGKLVDKIVGDLMGGAYGVPSIPLRQLVPKVSWFTSQITRDFTLKSSSSFGLFQLVKTWIDDWIIIFAIRQTGLCTTPIDLTQPTYQSSINITIPTQLDVGYHTDMPTAVPFSSMNNMSLPNNNLHISGGLEGYGNGNGAGTQYLAMPNFGDGNMITPRPIFQNTNEYAQVGGVEFGQPLSQTSSQVQQIGNEGMTSRPAFHQSNSDYSSQGSEFGQSQTQNQSGESNDGGGNGGQFVQA